LIREYFIQHQDMKGPLQQSYRNIALGNEHLSYQAKDDSSIKRELNLKCWDLILKSHCL